MWTCLFSSIFISRSNVHTKIRNVAEFLIVIKEHRNICRLRASISFRYNFSNFIQLNRWQIYLCLIDILFLNIFLRVMPIFMIFWPLKTVSWMRKKLDMQQFSYSIRQDTKVFSACFQYLLTPILSPHRRLVIIYFPKHHSNDIFFNRFLSFY